MINCDHNYVSYSGEAMNDLQHIITGKIRLRLLMKFFLNPNNRVYLRGLANEFNVSTNTVRQELEKLSDSGVIVSEKEKRKRLFCANTDHPLFSSIRKMLLQHTGVETVFEEVIMKLGAIDSVYLTGPLARGVDSSIIDIVVVGTVERNFLNRLTLKAEKMIGKKLRIACYESDEWNQDLMKGIDYVKVLG